MGLDGTLTTSAGQPTVGEQPYAVNQVKRDTIWTYDAGKPIFELTDPDGHVYVMQSYSQIVDNKLHYQDLPRLACRTCPRAGRIRRSGSPIPCS